MVKSIILMRHAEREDRAQELAGKDWISTAPRPQDPVLSARGMLIHFLIVYETYLISVMFMKVVHKRFW